MNNIPSQAITVIGAGSWGTALALHLAKSGQDVRLWSYNPEQINTLANDRVNSRYLPEHPFPATLKPIADLAKALEQTDDILIAVPSVGFHSTLMQLKPLLTTPKRIVWATKGMDLKTGQLLHTLALQTLGKQHAYAVLSGPSFAGEVAMGLPTAVVIASEDKNFTENLVLRFNHHYFRTYLSTDMTGVEICGVVKNVLAIAVGISDGMGFGSNARSALITRGLAEIIRLGTALGGKQDTFIGLAGMGDLVLTCTDNQSRNRRFGIALGKGKSVADAEQEIKQVVEGKRNAEQVVTLAHQHSIEMPIVEYTLKILQGLLTPQDAMRNLFLRETKTE